MMDDWKQQARNSEGFRMWRRLSSAQRIFFAGFAAFLAIVIVMLIVGYWDAPQLPSPSGEGG